MKTQKFTFKIQHDKGVLKISTYAESAWQARLQISIAEKCSPSALLFIKASK